MTASTVKSTRLTSRQASMVSGIPQKKGTQHSPVYSAGDTIALATTSLDETNDSWVFDINLPTNAIPILLFVRSDDLDSDGTPALAYDIGAVAAAPMTTFTSGTRSDKAQDAVLDADLFASAITIGQAAQAQASEQGFEALDINKANQTIWQMLGYDKDPNGNVNISCTVTTAADAAQAGDHTIQILYKMGQ